MNRARCEAEPDGRPPDVLILDPHARAIRSFSAGPCRRRPRIPPSIPRPDELSGSRYGRTVRGHPRGSQSPGHGNGAGDGARRPRPGPSAPGVAPPVRPPSRPGTCGTPLPRPRPGRRAAFPGCRGTRTSRAPGSMPAGAGAPASPWTPGSILAGAGVPASPSTGPVLVAPAAGPAAPVGQQRRLRTGQSGTIGPVAAKRVCAGIKASGPGRPRCRGAAGGAHRAPHRAGCPGPGRASAGCSRPGRARDPPAPIRDARTATPAARTRPCTGRDPVAAAGSAGATARPHRKRTGDRIPPLSRRHLRARRRSGATRTGRGPGSGPCPARRRCHRHRTSTRPPRPAAVRLVTGRPARTGR